jgi:hypothetical protein
VGPRPAGVRHASPHRAASPRRTPARPVPTTGRAARGRRTLPVALAALGVLLAMGAVLAFVAGQRTPAPAAAAMTAAPAAPAAPTAAPALPPPGPAVVTPAELARCPVAATACVDLAARTAWLQHDGKVTAGPVPMLPGAETFLRPPGPTSSATPTGSFHVLWKDANAFSSEFDEPMNHAVYFAKGGIAFHEGSLTTSSNGCIHLSAADATTFFDHLRPGDGVTVF